MQAQSILDMSFNKMILPISNTLLSQLSQVVNKYPEVVGNNDITINFKDKSYSAENGRYHSIDIALSEVV